LAVKIRLKKMGAKKKPFFRVVAADTRSPRDGRFIELLGYYNPMTDPPDLKFDEDKVYKWLDAGAEPTESAAQLLKRAGLLERWQLLKQGVKISELDAKIAERREKQPKPIPKEVKEAAREKKAEEKKEAEAPAEVKEQKAEVEAKPEEQKTEAEVKPEEQKAEAEAKPEEQKAEAEAKPEEPKAELEAKPEEPKAKVEAKPEETQKTEEPDKTEEPADDEKKE
jgi:small subunit ribosomal protein S16